MRVDKRLQGDAKAQPEMRQVTDQLASSLNLCLRGLALSICVLQPRYNFTPELQLSQPKSAKICES